MQIFVLIVLIYKCIDIDIYIHTYIHTHIYRSMCMCVYEQIHEGKVHVHVSTWTFPICIYVCI